MPIKASAFKALRKTAKRTSRNRNWKRLAYERIKASEKAIAQKTPDAAKLVQTACTTIDKAVQKGVFHSNTGARKKSTLMKHLNAVLKSS